MVWHSKNTEVKLWYLPTKKDSLIFPLYRCSLDKHFWPFALVWRQDLLGFSLRDMLYYWRSSYILTVVKPWYDKVIFFFVRADLSRLQVTSGTSLRMEIIPHLAETNSWWFLCSRFRKYNFPWDCSRTGHRHFNTYRISEHQHLHLFPEIYFVLTPTHCLYT